MIKEVSDTTYKQNAHTLCRLCKKGDLSGGEEAGREADWVDGVNTDSLKASPAQIKVWQQADPSLSHV